MGIFLGGRAGLVTSAIAFLALNFSASGAVLFGDDFSGDTPATSDTDAKYPELQGGDVGKAWAVFTTGLAENVQVSSNDPVTSGNNHVRLRRADLTSYGYSHAQLTDAATASAEDSIVTVSFRFYMSSSVPSTAEFRVLGHPTNTVGTTGSPNPIASFLGNAFAVRFQRSSQNVNFHLGANVDGSTGTATWKLDEWNEVLITIDYAQGQFQVEVTNSDGTTTSALRTFQDATVDRLGTVQFTVPGNGSDARFDDVLVELVPEPASAALLLLGAVTLLPRQRR
jgi:hypothetical protein